MRTLLGFIFGWISCYIFSSIFLDWVYSEKAVSLIAALTTSGTLIVGLLAILQPYWLVKRRRIRERRAETESLALEIIDGEFDLTIDLMNATQEKDLSKLPSEEALERHSEIVYKLHKETSKNKIKKTIDIDIENLTFSPIKIYIRDIKEQIHKDAHAAPYDITTSLVEHLDKLSELRERLTSDFLDKIFTPKIIKASSFKPPK